ncbi:MAG: cytochrome c oxidase subunit II [Candidatus Competibacteraceae bacterium]|nr:cytochrome c oxidase subunit II [Candidatus Competibacteraceae bacterium]
MILLGGCSTPQSALDPQGPAARAIAQAWWVMFWGAWAVLALVMGLVLYAVFRRPQSRSSGRAFIIGGGLLLPILTLAALLIYGTQIGNILTDRPSPAVRIEVTGHQWWWEVRYPDAPAGEVVTANEIHIPAARPVQLLLTSDDVIHSFWVPTLAGKLDLIPGKLNRLWIQADAPGRYRGQCAEFCGLQHARMALLVIAQPQADFDHWLTHQGRTPTAPADALRQRGRAAFLEVGCADCHTVRGTPADGKQGPDLTHVGSRHTLAALTLENTPDNLARWIAHNQALKPGNRMKSFDHLPDTQITAIAAWLASLR